MDSGLQIIRHPSYHRFSLSWFDVRVFYVRISHFTVDDSTPDCLTLNHIPSCPDTVLEVNGIRCPMDSEGLSCVLRRDRVDKKSEEATFITTDSIKLTESVKFEVFDKDNLVILGVLEMSGANGSIGEIKNNMSKKWIMKCESMISPGGCRFLKGKQIAESVLSPTIEVYVAGSFSGTPIVLTKTLQISPCKKRRIGSLHSIPEYDVPNSCEDVAPGHQLQIFPRHFSEVSEYKNYRSESEEDYEYSLYWRQMQYVDGEDGELTWFNAGVRVGVGIGLGVCLGIGIGVGLLVRTYQSTTRTFKRRLL